MKHHQTTPLKKTLLAVSTALYTAGLLAAAGQQNPPPGPGQIPDYFGVVPNFANSPQPMLTTVTITDGNSASVGVGADANATFVPNGAITGVTNLVGGHNYVRPLVTINDTALGHDAVVTPILGAGIATIVLDNPGAECLGIPAVTFNDPNGTGSGAVATAILDANNSITGFNITSSGSGYSSQTTVSVACSDTAATGSVTLTPGNPGDLIGINIVNAGTQYSSAATVNINDPGATPGSGASATVQINANGGLTGFNFTSGTGYSNLTTVSIQDVATGSGATATAISSGTHKINGQKGVITKINITAGGNGYRAPVISISDGSATGGSGAVAVATTYDYANDVVTDKIMDVQVLDPGSNYDANTTVTVSGGADATPVDLTAIIENGSIKGFEEIPSANNPNSPTNFTGLGSGYGKPLPGTGIHKFVDTLPGLNSPNNLGQQLPVAVPDQSIFPNSDYYEIAEVEYKQKLHTDLPATLLRGYVQIKADGFTVAGFNTAPDKLAYASQYAGYLGPVIVAKKDRAVRVKLVNLLSKTSDNTSLMKGKLSVPVDTTYMGADGPTDTDNRAVIHLHGGNTPWISDGTTRQWVKPTGEIGPNKGGSARDVPDMWFDASGNLIPNSATCTQGTTNCTTPGAVNSPGDGALTYYYTNEQSARLMFYHDHAEGTTRLNVYAGVAAGYVLQDPTEQAMVNGGTAQQAALEMGYSPAEAATYDNNTTFEARTLPNLADTIPLVIQEKTFIPDDTTPVLNFYGPFKSQLNSQDPTWRWGTGIAPTGAMGNGDLWVPHVFMPNQNPGDISGANSVGRWDYGPWFWPPFVNIQNGEIDNPYFDSTCDTTTTYCEGPKIPGVPNGSKQSVNSNGVPGGVHDATHGGAITESPSGTPEAFNDTPLVNGTAYPYITVDPKKYRLRFLSVGNDRMLNLSLVVAASKNSKTTAEDNRGSASNAVLCDGTTGVSREECTEVKMVPFDAAQNTSKPFPAWWYTKQKGGVTFDGRPSGVFDPATRGPQMVQIGTEGGFLAAPVAIPNQPVNYEYNPKNILIGNVKEHALLLGPAERADVLVDFSNFAGSTLILYNDSPAPMPAWDLRLDYYTGGFDNTDTGGAFSVIPGYGPNSRTLMQIRVNGSGGSHPVDDLGTINMASLTSAVRSAFKTSQEPIIVPQNAYATTYGLTMPDGAGADLSRISDYKLTYTPIDTTTSPNWTMAANPVTLELEPKNIIEDWTMNWGRMNALLGVEIPHTSASVQTSIPLAFVDPPTDLVKITPNDNMVPITGTLPDGTQIWKITHNGVDSHAVHFHLFHVQLVNRVGWDGAIYPPDANELGWKDTVRMNPLSDTIVALRPMKMNLPFKVANSHRLLDPKQAIGGNAEFFNIDPLTNNASTVTNQEVNFGWEYLWHCHILGHEENDMMHSIAVAQPPETPSTVSATGANAVSVTWTDNSIISNWVTIQRSRDGLTDAKGAFTHVDATFNVVEPECNNQAGCTRTYTDVSAPVATSVYYRIMANNTVGAGDGKLDAPRNPDGTYSVSLPPELSSLTPGFAGYANVTANSEWSNTGARLAIPVASVSPTTLALPNTLVGTTSAVMTATLSNTGTGVLNIASITATAPFNRPAGVAGGTCGATLAPGANCTIGVTFIPTTYSETAQTGALTITDNSNNVVGSTQTVNLSGIGMAAIASVSPSSLSFGNVSVGTNSATQNVTLTNSGNAALTITNIAISPGTGFSKLAGGCGNSLAANSSCSISLRFSPTSAGSKAATLTITDSSFGNNTQTVALSGTGVSPTPPVASIPASLSFGNLQVGSNSTQPVVLSNTGTSALSISNITVTSGASFTRVTTGPGIVNNCGSTLAGNANCNIYVRFAPTTGGDKTGAITVADNSNNVTGSTQTVALSGTGTISAVNDINAVAPTTGTGAQTIAFNVRFNDSPATGGTVAIVGTPTVINGGASAVASVVNNQVSWSLIPTGTTGTARANSKRGTYTVVYSLTNGAATAQATYTLTVN